MSTQHRHRDWLIVLFVVAVLLFNYPLLNLVNRTTMLAGIPVLYFYLFAVWLLLIVAAAWIVWHYRGIASESGNSDEHA